MSRPRALEHFQVKWTHFAVENAMNATTEHFQAKRIRSAAENAFKTKTGVDSVITEMAPGALPREAGPPRGRRRAGLKRSSSGRPDRQQSCEARPLRRMASTSGPKTRKVGSCNVSGSLFTKGGAFRRTSPKVWWNTENLCRRVSP